MTECEGCRHDYNEKKPSTKEMKINATEDLPCNSMCIKPCFIHTITIEKYIYVCDNHYMSLEENLGIK